MLAVEAIAADVSLRLVASVALVAVAVAVVSVLQLVAVGAVRPPAAELAAAHVPDQDIASAALHH